MLANIFDGASMGAVIDGISADLAASAALAGSSAAAAGQFEVDLQALYDHHAQVLVVHDELSTQWRQLGSSSSGVSTTGSTIPGVQDSLTTTFQSAVGSGDSMYTGIAVVLNQITTYADAIAAVYLSYVHADTSGASQLTAAGDPGAAKVALPSSG